MNLWQEVAVTSIGLFALVFGGAALTAGPFMLIDIAIGAFFTAISIPMWIAYARESLNVQRREA